MMQLENFLPAETPESVKASLVKEFGETYSEVILMCEQAMQLVVTDESDTETMAKAGESRKFLKKIRTSSEKRAKELKDEFLVKGRAIDAVRKEFKTRIGDAEAHLEKQEKFLEIREIERINALEKDRSELISQVGGDPSVYRGLGAMGEDQFSALLEGVKHQVRKRIEEQEEAERRRKEEEEEKERLRQENARKEEELAAQQRALEEERRKREQAEAEVKQREEAEAAQKKADEDRLAAEAKAKEDAERAAAMAPAREKVKKLMILKDPVDPELAQEIGPQNSELIRQAARQYNAALKSIAMSL